MTQSIQQPLVSVVMATYNGENFLSRQLDSVLNQTYTNLEIIIVDDKSTDNTAFLLKNYAAKHANITVIINEEKLGYVKNFEKGFLLANGHYIAPCDQDDVWDINKINILINEIGEHEIIYSNSELIDGNGERLHKKLSDVKGLKSFNSCLNFIIGNSINSNSMLIKKEVIERCIPFHSIIPHNNWLGFVATFKGPIKFYNKVLVLDRQLNVNNKNKIPHNNAINRERIHILYNKCPENLTTEKKVLLDLNNSYQSFSVKNNWLRMRTFFKSRREILVYENKTVFEKWLLCFKMFICIK